VVLMPRGVFASAGVAIVGLLLFYAIIEACARAFDGRWCFGLPLTVSGHSFYGILPTTMIAHFDGILQTQLMIKDESRITTFVEFLICGKRVRRSSSPLCAWLWDLVAFKITPDCSDIRIFWRVSIHPCCHLPLCS